MSRYVPPRSRVSLVRSGIASLLLLATAALLIASPAAAQDALDSPSASDTEPTSSGQFNIRGTVGVPRGGLRDNVGGPSGGLHLYFGAWIGERPFLIGADVGFLNYGHTTDQVPFSSTVGPRVPVEVTTSNNVLETHLSMRLQPREGRLRPYIEGLAGFKYLFTRTRVGDEDFGDDNLGDDIASSTNYDDFALSGGAGAGVDIRVFRPDDPAKKVRGVSLHLGVQYLLGSEAEYLSEGELSDENDNGRLDQSELDVRRSRTTFLQPQFGVTLRFSSDEE
jgi:hypothetical protein